MSRAAVYFPLQNLSRRMSPPSSGKSRLTYIDWIRGLACLLMFQTHCYDSWLGGSARQSRFFMYSQLGGTFPAPLFLFLAGISFALVTEKLRQKNLPARQIASATIRRGAEILGFGLLFRLQEYLVAWGWAPTSDLFRVDVLNTIGVSMMLMGVVCWIILGASGAGKLPTSPATAANSRRVQLSFVWGAAFTALLISLVTPMLWTTWSPRFLPWPIASYINGVHNLGQPQSTLFPIFPWTGFAFAGLAVGFILQSEWIRAREAKAFLCIAVAGAILIEFARWLEAQPRQIYPVNDYWHTSPSFFLIRVGMLLVILSAGYAWCRWGAAQWGFSPLIQLGEASLIVYWIHIEFVYGRVSILPKRAEGIGAASAGLFVIFLAMVALAYARTKLKGRGVNVLTWFGHAPERA